jgi:hypothetical protein
LKLEEAEFFLDLAEKSQDNVKVFSFFINAFFAAATSIRVGKGVMKTEYRNIQGFKAWFQKARDNLNVKFPIDFWVDKTRNGIIHREGNIQGDFRRKVTAALRLQRNKDGRMSVIRDDPPPDNRLRFAAGFYEKEGGNVIVDRCWDYLDALTHMIVEWENKLAGTQTSD